MKEDASHYRDHQREYLKVYEEHANAVLAFLRSKTSVAADDLHQIVFLKGWKKFSTDSASVTRGWLITTAKNSFIDWYRRERRMTIAEGDLVDESGDQPYEALLESERAAQLDDCIKELQEIYRVVFQARFRGEDYQSIADRLEMTHQQVYKRNHTAVAKLRQCVEGKSRENAST
ncbi:MAG: sigma-70 family RNA polymerase sigma factor [bacterium]|nr:sigma-70 family RNA polymerase sigma factor [bacterium]